jgi:hypothetical protein
MLPLIVGTLTRLLLGSTAVTGAVKSACKRSPTLVAGAKLSEVVVVLLILDFLPCPLLQCVHTVISSIGPDSGSVSLLTHCLVITAPLCANRACHI